MEDTLRKQDMYLGLDIGGTNIKSGLVNPESTQVSEYKSTPSRIDEGKIAVLKRILGVIKSYDLDSLEGIGIGIAGSIDAKSGNVEYSPNLFHDLFPLGDFLNEEIKSLSNNQLEIRVENDVRVCALSLHHFYYKDIDDFICIYLGTGIGSGIITNGRLLKGSSNSAGEIGHTIINSGGALCSCGNLGCFEAEASGQGALRKIRAMLNKHKEGSLYERYIADPDGLELVVVHDEAEGGDWLAGSAWEEFIKYLTIGVANAVTIFNPRVLVLGGGVLESCPFIVDEVKERFTFYANPVSARNCRIELVRFGKETSILGAGLLFKY